MREILLVGLLGCGFRGPPELGNGTPLEAGIVPLEAGTVTDGRTLIDGTLALDAAIVPTGLIAWYQMDTAPPPAIDATGHDHNGTCTNGCPTLTTGKIGEGFQFTGQRVDVVDAPDLRPTAFTLAYWAKWNALPANNGFSCPAGKYLGGGQLNSWQLCLEGTNGSGGSDWWFYTQHTNGVDMLTTQSSVTTGVWHHAAATYDGTLKHIYIDGVAAPPTTGPTSALTYDVGPLTLGADINNTNIDSQFIGVLDDVRLYNRALSAAEILLLATP